MLDLVQAWFECPALLLKHPQPRTDLVGLIVHATFW